MSTGTSGVRRKLGGPIHFFDRLDIEVEGDTLRKEWVTTVCGCKLVAFDASKEKDKKRWPLDTVDLDVRHGRVVTCRHCIEVAMTMARNAGIEVVE